MPFDLIYLLAMLAYVLVGSVVARHVYIDRSREFFAIKDSEEARGERIEEIQTNLKKLDHGICNLNYSALRERGCDCSSKRRWEDYHTELTQLQAGGPLIKGPKPPYDILLTWPFSGLHHFMTPNVEPVVNGEVVETKEEHERPLASRPDTYRYIDVDNDPTFRAIKEQGERIAALAEAELGKAKEKDPDAFVTNGDGVSHVIAGDGTIIKTFRERTTFLSF